MLYYKTNYNRKSEFQTYVEILENNRVKKGALNKLSNKHIDSIYQNALKLSKISDHFDLHYRLEDCCVSCDLVQGISLSELLKKDLINGHFEKMIDRINHFFLEMEDLLPHCDYQKQDSLFGEIIEDPSLVYTNVANLDFNFDNIFILEDDYKVIDCEWCFDCIIPIEFLKYRSLLYFYTKSKEAFTISLDQFFDLFQIQPIVNYQHYEESFQQYVYGSQRKYNVLDQFFSQNRGTRNQQDAFIQIYLDQGGINEENSILCPITSRHIHQVIEIHQAVDRLRIDLCNFASIIQVNTLTLKTSSKTTTYSITDLVGNGVSYENQIVYIDNDPQLMIENINEEVLQVILDFDIIKTKEDPDYEQAANRIFDLVRNQIKILENDIKILEYKLKHPIRTFVKKVVKRT